MPGTLFVVATPIGNLEDITVRALRVLREATIIAAEDTRRTAHLLARHGISTPTTSLHEHNEGKKSASILAKLRDGASVALVSDAGTPTVSDPGFQLIRETIAAGIKVEPIPGPSAILTALAASGLPAEPFTFVGFPPTRLEARKSWLRDLGERGGTVVLFEAPHRIRKTLEELGAVFGDREAVVGRELTKIHEEFVRGPISALAARFENPRGEFTIVINIGHKTEIEAVSPPQGRREALAAVAKSYGLTANELYAAIEAAKGSGKSQT
ncbi:MAG TPA: 16S rRNA (cytidine(1402)-2'-O)-methyltransferase [Vicinamibacterales bacterium]|jgi:16S rRNA (cytidine1402-2'-O)-methyltransferase